MIDFLAGAVTLAYIIAATFFVRFWRRTHDRLFLAFAVAFGLIALNQIVVLTIGVGDERSNYAYILRVLGYLLILAGIVDKNLFHEKRPRL